MISLFYGFSVQRAHSLYIHKNWYFDHVKSLVVSSLGTFEIISERESRSNINFHLLIQENGFAGGGGNRFGREGGGFGGGNSP